MAQPSLRSSLLQMTDDMSLLELSDELQVSLQMSDQLTYDNAFVYFQPGSGKVDIKGPTSTLNKAVEQLDEIIKQASSN